MIILATDSTAYLTRQEAKELSVVHIPMTYSICGDVYAETFHKEDARFRLAEQKAKAGEVRTSQPAMGAFIRRFKRLVDSGCEVLCLTLSQRLSGTYNNALECAKEFGDKVCVVDTRTTAAGLYLLAEKARELIDRGMTLKDTQARILSLSDRLMTRFSVADLAPLRRSGRLGFVRQSVGTILNQRPILSCQDGAVVCVDTARGRNDQLRKLADAVPQDAERVIVQYCTNREGAAALAERLSSRIGADVPIRRIGVVLGVHLGFDVIGVVWLEPAK